MGKECMVLLSRRLWVWGGTSLKTAAKEASTVYAVTVILLILPSER